uniref:Uncharacterized protein n=1 Tax=Glossina pallidipes TaxID=7398 RepID=A0A1A9ZVP6_GLOPL
MAKRMGDILCESDNDSVEMSEEEFTSYSHNADKVRVCCDSDSSADNDIATIRKRVRRLSSDEEIFLIINYLSNKTTSYLRVLKIIAREQMTLTCYCSQANFTGPCPGHVPNSFFTAIGTGAYWSQSDGGIMCDSEFWLDVAMPRDT